MGGGQQLLLRKERFEFIFFRGIDVGRRGVVGEGAEGGGGAGGTCGLIAQQQALDLAVGGMHEAGAWFENKRQNPLYNKGVAYQRGA